MSIPMSNARKFTIAIHAATVVALTVTAFPEFGWRWTVSIALGVADVTGWVLLWAWRPQQPQPSASQSRATTPRSIPNYWSPRSTIAEVEKRAFLWHQFQPRLNASRSLDSALKLIYEMDVKITRDPSPTTTPRRRVKVTCPTCERRLRFTLARSHRHECRKCHVTLEIFFCPNDLTTGLSRTTCPTCGRGDLVTWKAVDGE
jgi:NMD protein affecting ribosome stability and mRNA decay